MQVENISKILALQNSLYDYNDYNEIIDFIVNDTYKIIQYQLAVVVERNPNKPQILDILKISGTIDTKDQEVSKSFKSWLHRTIQIILASSLLENNNTTNKKQSITIVHPSNLDSHIRAEWAENLGQELIFVKLYSNKEGQKEIFLVVEERRPCWIRCIPWRRHFLFISTCKINRINTPLSLISSGNFTLTGKHYNSTIWRPSWTFI